MNEYPKNNNVIIRERIKVDYLERNSHVAKIVGVQLLTMTTVKDTHDQKYNQWTLAMSCEVWH